LETEAFHVRKLLETNARYGKYVKKRFKGVGEVGQSYGTIIN